MAATTKQQLIEDRALRDAARQVIDADIAFIKGDLAQRSLGDRLKDRAEDGAIEAAEYADDHPDKMRIAAVATAGVAVWLLRDQIADALAALFRGFSDEEDEPCDCRDAAEWAERNKCCSRPVG